MKLTFLVTVVTMASPFRLNRILANKSGWPNVLKTEYSHTPIYSYPFYSYASPKTTF